MRARNQRAFRPRVEGVEDRCLLSLAVLEIQNKSTYNITFSFRWTPSSSWTSYTEAPGQGEIFWTAYSDALTPQALYNTSSYAGSTTTENLVQGYGEWGGSGTPPASSATLYQFQDTATGLELYYAAPPTPTQAVVEVLNESEYNITFEFRWTTSSSWASYSEGPGQGEIFWTTYSTGLTPQALYNTTTSPGSQLTVNLAQGYGQWTGSGTPPASAATLYQFQDTATGVELYYAPSAPTPTPGPAPSPTSSPNWSGYAVASNFSDPQLNSVTAVSGSWNVPAVTGSSVGTLDSSTWVGIDGDTDQTVEQIGTEQDVVDGTPVYRAWWEMYSSGIQQPEQVITGMTIMPGDSISASVQYITSGAHAGQFYLSIVDNSRPGDSFSTYQTSAATQSPLAERSNAEWIMEAPSVNGTIVQIPTFSTVNFTNASVTIDGVTGGISSPSWQSQALNIVTNGAPQDTTSALTSSGSGFSVTCSSGVGAGIEMSSGLQTAQTQVGDDDPQVIVVGQQWNPASPTQLVVAGQPASVAVGTGFGLTIDVEDGDGDVVAGYDGPVTLSLVPGAGASLGGPLTVDAVGGVATFSGLSLSAAGTYTIDVQSGALAPTSVTIAAEGAADPATRWTVAAAPPASVAAGGAFGFAVRAVDAGGNTIGAFSGLATVVLTGANGATLGGGPQVVATQGGVATFSDLMVSQPGSYTLTVSGAGLSPTSFGLLVTAVQPPPVLPPPVLPAPVVTGISPIDQTIVTGRGRHARRTVRLIGYAIGFNEALETATAANPGNYALTQSVKHRRSLISQSVPFGVSYDPATATVDVDFAGAPAFTYGGTFIVFTGNLVGADGTRGAGQSSYTILRQGAGITG